MEIVKRPAPPTGLRRKLWRLPILLYRLGLGALLGGRVMLLNHVGRVSGLPRQVVIEVVEHDENGYVAASGFGVKADWYRNVTASPEVTIQVGGRVHPVTAVPLPAEAGAVIMARYASQHPTAARRLCKLMGYAVDESQDDYHEVGKHIPFVRFVPR
ncbi:nitroreductase family deazaflavin-dependent oxidoreductase [Nonomuraea salmonea]|uniref:Nitroreductase family deazaflavin-dependent oxidoreductase n=1 Tax=Nonomuraea salmonea TaxID=46181 RepID=A0ABV5NH18_9ACTN